MITRSPLIWVPTNFCRLCALSLPHRSSLAHKKTTFLCYSVFPASVQLGPLENCTPPNPNWPPNLMTIYLFFKRNLKCPFLCVVFMILLKIDHLLFHAQCQHLLDPLQVWLHLFIYMCLLTAQDSLSTQCVLPLSMSSPSSLVPRIL